MLAAADTFFQPRPSLCTVLQRGRGGRCNYLRRELVGAEGLARLELELSVLEG